MQARLHCNVGLDIGGSATDTYNFEGEGCVLDVVFSITQTTLAIYCGAEIILSIESRRPPRGPSCKHETRTVDDATPVVPNNWLTGTLTLNSVSGNAYTFTGVETDPDVTLVITTPNRLWDIGSAYAYKLGVLDSSVREVLTQQGVAASNPLIGDGVIVDVVAPTVLSVTPADEATGVAAAVHPAVTFSQAMDAATLTTSTVKLLDSLDAAVTCTLAKTVGNTVATLTPAAPLTNEAVYRIRVTTGVTDVAGNPLAAQYTQATGFTIVAA